MPLNEKNSQQNWKFSAYATVKKYSYFNDFVQVVPRGSKLWQNIPSKTYSGSFEEKKHFLYFVDCFFSVPLTFDLTGRGIYC